MKHVPDDTIYRLKNTGTRVRIVEPKQFPSQAGTVASTTPPLFVMVAQVKDGHRWLAKPSEILTEKDWLASRKA